MGGIWQFNCLLLTDVINHRGVRRDPFYFETIDDWPKTYGQKRS